MRSVVCGVRSEEWCEKCGVSSEECGVRCDV